MHHSLCTSIHQVQGTSIIWLLKLVVLCKSVENYSENTVVHMDSPYLWKHLPSKRTTIHVSGRHLSSTSNFLTYSYLDFAILTELKPASPRNQASWTPKQGVIQILHQKFSRPFCPRGFVTSLATHVALLIFLGRSKTPYIYTAAGKYQSESSSAFSGLLSACCWWPVDEAPVQRLPIQLLRRPFRNSFRAWLWSCGSPSSLNCYSETGVFETHFKQLSGLLQSTKDLRERQYLRTFSKKWVCSFCLLFAIFHPRVCCYAHSPYMQCMAVQYARC